MSPKGLVHRLFRWCKIIPKKTSGPNALCGVEAAGGGTTAGKMTDLFHMRLHATYLFVQTLKITDIYVIIKIYPTEASAVKTCTSDERMCFL